MSLKSFVLFLVALLLSSALSQSDPKHQADLARDIEMGKQTVADLDKELVFSTDAALIERVNRIGGVLAEISKRHHIPATWGDKRHNVFEYTFKVVEDKDVNAFSVPGGFIYVNTGLIEFVESDDELAGVLAHEIAHAANRHLITLIKERSKVDLITLPIVLAALLKGGQGAEPALMTQSLLLTALTSGWSQSAERDADRTGFYYMQLSQYNPVGLLTFMERLAFRERNSPQIDWGIFRTHPPSRQRADALVKLLKEHGISLARSAVTTSFRVTSEIIDDMCFIRFGSQDLFTLKGPRIEERSKEVVSNLNQFFDTNPELFQVKAVGARVLFDTRTLVEFMETDIVDGKSRSELASEAVLAIRRALYSLGFRTAR